MKTYLRLLIPAIISISAVATLTSSGSATSTPSITGCEFGANQVFDVQYNISASTLNVSNLAYPFSAVSSSQLNASSYAPGDYFQFTDAAGIYTLALYDSSNTLKSQIANSGTFSAIGPDFLFYVQNGTYGTLITTAGGYNYGDSASFQVDNSSPGPSDLSAWNSCSVTPLATGTTTTTETPTTTTTTTPEVTTTTTTETPTTTTTTPPLGVTTTTTPHQLPYTGADTTKSLFAALIALLAGADLLLVVRRRTLRK